MGKYKINILQIAQDDMKSIVAHISLDDSDAAIRMVGKIRTAIGRLADYPLMGAVPRDRKTAQQGYRMVVVEPYLIFYIFVSDNTTVEIHRVLHRKQDYPNIL